MDIEIVDASDIKNIVKGKRYEIKKARGEICKITKTPMELLPKDMVSCDDIVCERAKKGMTDNCSLCQHVNNDIFIKCETKFSE